MLKEGIPLEGALHQLTSNMGNGKLRRELELLEKDLEKGTPLKTAVASRELPLFYIKMVEVGVASDDLPGVLLLLADYYRSVDATWTRLTGLMVYPVLVIAAAFGLSCFLTMVVLYVTSTIPFDDLMLSPGRNFIYRIWFSPIFLGLLLLTVSAVLLVPSLHRRLRWRLPAFKEAKLAQVASAMGIMIKKGCNLNDALILVQSMEQGTIASTELSEWHQNLKHGHGQFSEMAEPGKAFPPLFFWLITNAGEDLADGFRRAGEVYKERADRGIEKLLHAALPFSILLLGVMVLLQMLPVIQMLVRIMNVSGGGGG